MNFFVFFEFQLLRRLIIVETKVYFPPANLKHIMTKHGLKNIGLCPF